VSIFARHREFKVLAMRIFHSRTWLTKRLPSRIRVVALRARAVSSDANRQICLPAQIRQSTVRGEVMLGNEVFLQSKIEVEARIGR
jgi:hypothetical protein